VTGRRVTPVVEIVATSHPYRPLVGVIGGVGPLSTAYFLERLIRLTDAHHDQDHIDAIVFNHAGIPDRTDYLVGRSDVDPGPILAADARRLEAFGSSFLVMPCNTAHYFYQTIERAVAIPFISIVDVTVAEALRRYPTAKAVGLLATEGTVASGVYHNAFQKYGVEVIVPDLDDQAVINNVIYEQVKAGLPVDVAAIRVIARKLVGSGASVVLLGCTELSVVALDHHLLIDPIFLDTMETLVRATIIEAGHHVRR